MTHGGRALRLQVAGAPGLHRLPAGPSADALAAGGCRSSAAGPCGATCISRNATTPTSSRPSTSVRSSASPRRPQSRSTTSISVNARARWRSQERLRIAHEMQAAWPRFSPRVDAQAQAAAFLLRRGGIEEVGRRLDQMAEAARGLRRRARGHPGAARFESPGRRAGTAIRTASRR